MKNFLGNGTVLPSGLLGGQNGGMAGFNKTYRNTPLRIGVIVESFPANHEKNISKLSTEYDVIAIEQDEDKASTAQLYRNCLSSSGLGSIADFFDVTLRKRKKKKYKGDSPRLKEQNGTVCLLLCLDGNSEKAIIVGCFPHPDRKTTLANDEPRLEGEYNGVNVKVESDGSTSIIFKGATDNDGKIIDSSQGPTTIKIEKDGSYQVDHKTITQRFAKDGNASLTADNDISNTTKKNFNITATENVNVKSTKNTSMQMAELLINASGSATMEVQKLSLKAQSEIKLEGVQFQLEASAMAKIKATTVIIDGLVSLGGAGGQPVLLLSTQFMGTGNAGLPVISTAIAGFATKVLAT
jgi:hypothetical protein